MTPSGRKYLLALISLGLLTAMTIAAIWVPKIEGLLSTFITGMVSVLGLYYTGNVANKYVIGKTTGALYYPNQQHPQQYSEDSQEEV